MGSVLYNGEVVESVISQIKSISNTIPSISSGIRSATSKIISAKGFQRYVGGVSSDTFSSVIDTCQEVVNDFSKQVRQKQVSVLAYSQDQGQINAFLDKLNRSDYDNLDLSELDSYIGLDRKIGNFFNGIGATVTTFGLGLLEGVGNLLETGADLVVLGVSGAATIFTGATDLITGSNFTQELWEDTRAFVSDKKVENVFNSLYNDTEFGQSLKENAYAFEGARNIGSGLAYTAGMIGLNVLTGGIASGLGVGAAGSIGAGQLAATAGLLGFSSGTEDAWNDGAETGAGLIFGVASGAWNAVQWYTGAKINQYGGLGDKIAQGIFKGAASGVGTRIAMDAGMGAVDSFVNPALTMIYKDYGQGNIVDNYKTAFEKAGGWTSVGTSVLMSGATSAVGEFIGARKLLKAANADEDTVDESAKKIFNGEEGGNGVGTREALDPMADENGKRAISLKGLDDDLSTLDDDLLRKTQVDALGGTDAASKMIFAESTDGALQAGTKEVLGEVSLEKRVVDGRIVEVPSNYKVVGVSPTGTIVESNIPSEKVFRNVMSESTEEVMERVEKVTGVKITFIGDTLIPESNIPISATVEINGKQYYLNSVIKDGKVEGATKHVFEQVKLTLSSEFEPIADKVDQFFKEKGVDTTCAEISKRFEKEPRKAVGQISNKIISLLEKEGTIAKKNYSGEETNAILKEFGFFDNNVSLENMRTNLKLAGIDVGDLSQYSVEELKRINGEASFSVFMNGLKEYDSGALAKQAVGSMPVETVKTGVPTWVDASNGRGDEYLIEVITRASREGEAGDLQVHHMIHKSGAITMEQSATQQGARNFIEPICNTKKVEYNIMNQAIEKNTPSMPLTYEAFKQSPNKDDIVSSVIKDLTESGYARQSAIGSEVYRSYANKSVEIITSNPELSSLVEKVIEAHYEGDKAYTKALEKFGKALEKYYKKVSDV